MEASVTMNVHPRNGERGSALIVVLLLGLIAVAMVSAMMVFASTSTPLARNDQDWTGSLSAAEAGIDDYLYRLSKDSSYWQKAVDPNNPALGTAAAGAAVPGDASEAKFKYTVTPPSVTLNGTVKLRVNGNVRNNNRTIEATLRRDGFLDYLYFSKFETVDPLSYSTTGSPDRNWADANCANRYYYAVGSSGQPGYIPPRVTSGSTTCNEIRWVTGDVLDGPLHTNDAPSALTRLLEPLSARLERRDRGAARLLVELRLVTRASPGSAQEIHARQLDLPSPIRDVRTLRTLALLELLYGSGLRASELVSLHSDAVPRDAPFLTVTGKGGQQRMVPVSSRARQALSRWLAVKCNCIWWLASVGLATRSRRSKAF